MIILSKTLDSNTYKSSIEKNGKELINLIEKECEKDKSMSNLKGKVKEIHASEGGQRNEKGLHICHGPLAHTPWRSRRLSVRSHRCSRR
jgi:hypothetical protein